MYLGLNMVKGSLLILCSKSICAIKKFPVNLLWFWCYFKTNLPTKTHSGSGAIQSLKMPSSIGKASHSGGTENLKPTHRPLVKGCSFLWFSKILKKYILWTLRKNILRRALVAHWAQIKTNKLADKQNRKTEPSSHFYREAFHINCISGNSMHWTVILCIELPVHTVFLQPEATLIRSSWNPTNSTGAFSIQQELCVSDQSEWLYSNQSRECLLDQSNCKDLWSSFVWGWAKDQVWGFLCM